MTIKYNVNENSQLNTKEQDIKPVNASEDKTTVSILSIGGENGDNKNVSPNPKRGCRSYVS